MLRFITWGLLSLACLTVITDIADAARRVRRGRVVVANGAVIVRGR